MAVMSPAGSISKLNEYARRASASISQAKTHRIPSRDAATWNPPIPQNISAKVRPDAQSFVEESATCRVSLIIRNRADDARLTIQTQTRKAINAPRIYLNFVGALVPLRPEPDSPTRLPASG